jgi:UDP-galactopyranose mutase
MRESYDYLIVGAGLSGLVLAERLGSLGRTSLVVEKRDHIGGNCHDRKDRQRALLSTSTARITSAPTPSWSAPT